MKDKTIKTKMLRELQAGLVSMTEKLESILGTDRAFSWSASPRNHLLEPLNEGNSNAYYYFLSVFFLLILYLEYSQLVVTSEPYIRGSPKALSIQHYFLFTCFISDTAYSWFTWCSQIQSLCFRFIYSENKSLVPFC